MGIGMTTTTFGELMLNLDAHDTIRLDGDESTTMYLQDFWLNDIVNYPSDNQIFDHYGSPSISDGLYINLVLFSPSFP
jgi:exopolysaccharide biosynthesis protein